MSVLVDTIHRQYGDVLMTVSWLRTDSNWIHSSMSVMGLRELLRYYGVITKDACSQYG